MCSCFPKTRVFEIAGTFLSKRRLQALQVSGVNMKRPPASLIRWSISDSMDLFSRPNAAVRYLCATTGTSLAIAALTVALLFASRKCHVKMCACVDCLCHFVFMQVNNFAKTLWSFPLKRRFLHQSVGDWAVDSECQFACACMQL